MDSVSPSIVSGTHVKPKRSTQLVDRNVPLLKSIFMGARNGFLFGAGVRLPVALLTALFLKKLRGKSLLNYVVQQVAKHAIGLSMYAFFYKLLRRILRDIRGVPFYDAKNTFVVGGLIGAILLGQPTSGNKEVVLYCLKFIAEGLIYLVSRELKWVQFPSWAYPLTTFIVLGTLFSLTENYPGVMKKSFVRSMNFIYQDK